ncbi:MAG: autotransporter outer membrane beta-barrel domain-containing protein, partial [Succinivibrio sp.]|nr:autotransporter outer membrane beta-barrel domain-containing protein [Succinivibrio sp.]
VALNQGADTSSSAAFNLAHSGMTGTQAFSSVGGGAARAKTGSHVTLNSLNFSVGIGNNMPTAYGTFSIGGAFEAGYGRFKNHFDAGSADPYIKKSGHVSYYGVALLGNMEFTNLWHVNAALRYGRMSSKVSDGLYDESAGRKYDIDIGANYFGVELGGGKVIKLNDKDSIDLYGKYFFLYQKGDNFSTSAETYKLDAVKSHRLRLAGRYMHAFTPKTSLYAGLGLEHEFDGKSKLKINTNSGTFNAEPSKQDGTRAFAEVGVRIVPEGNKGFNFDLGIKGLCGEKYRGA